MRKTVPILTVCVSCLICAGAIPASAVPREDPEHSPKTSFRHESASSTGMSVVFTAAQDTEAVSFVSEKRAFNYSLYGTLIPMPTLLFTIPGLIVGPSLGYFQADLNKRAWTGIGLRTLATGGMISAFAICGWDCGPGSVGYNEAWAVFLGSSGLLIGSAVYDIATVKGAVRYSNEVRGKTAWTIEPAYYSVAKAVGVRVRLTF